MKGTGTLLWIAISLFLILVVFAILYALQDTFLEPARKAPGFIAGSLLFSGLSMKKTINKPVSFGSPVRGNGKPFLARKPWERNIVCNMRISGLVEKNASVNERYKGSFFLPQQMLRTVIFIGIAVFILFSIWFIFRDNITKSVAELFAGLGGTMAFVKPVSFGSPVRGNGKPFSLERKTLGKKKLLYGIDFVDKRSVNRGDQNTLYGIDSVDKQSVNRGDQNTLYGIDSVDKQGVNRGDYGVDFLDKRSVRKGYKGAISLPSFILVSLLLTIITVVILFMVFGEFKPQATKEGSNYILSIFDIFFG